KVQRGTHADVPDDARREHQTYQGSYGIGPFGQHPLRVLTPVSKGTIALRPKRGPISKIQGGLAPIGPIPKRNPWLPSLDVHSHVKHPRSPPRAGVGSGMKGYRLVPGGHFLTP